MTTSKHKYIALLRGINVGGKSIIKMADLRKMMEAMGFTDVETYIQSGNVLFTSTKSDPEQLALQIAKKITASLRKAVTVFVMTPAELKRAAAHNPFDLKRLGKNLRSHLMFLSGEPDAAHRNALMATKGEEYSFSVHGKVLYFAYPSELEGRRRTINFEKMLGVSGTARNWKVVNKLIQLTA